MRRTSNMKFLKGASTKQVFEEVELGILMLSNILVIVLFFFEISN